MENRTYLGDSSDHVSDDGLESGDRASLFLSTKPHFNIQVIALSFLRILLHLFHFYGHMLEALGNLSFGSFYCYLSCLRSQLNYDHGSK